MLLSSFVYRFVWISMEGVGPLQNGRKSKCASLSHNLLLDNAKNRIDDLQERFSSIRAARKEGRTGEVTVLEEQVCQSLREWKAELEAPSPASSLLGGSLGNFSDEIGRLLQLFDEEDDATSKLVEHAIPKPEPNVQSLAFDDYSVFEHEYIPDNDIQIHCFQGFDQPNNSLPLHNPVFSTPEKTASFDNQQFIFDQGFEHGHAFGPNDSKDFETKNLPISPSPSAFMGPKCALWDCTRPAQGSEWFEDYCSSFHANLALNEGLPGVNPILRPMGIGVKDNLLFNALTAKAQGKNVGIPQCEGAANTKAPWNAKDLFDLSMLSGETIREWLFFDKPRRAFESGNRKQRALPDYNGRGWHESRKQIMKEFGGNKRSYYMDPQPPGGLDWHLFEYEINGHDTCALYRLELKLATEKKSPKGKIMKESLADLQKRMGRLTAEAKTEESPGSKGSVGDAEKPEKH